MKRQVWRYGPEQNAYNLVQLRNSMLVGLKHDFCSKITMSMPCCNGLFPLLKRLGYTTKTKIVCVLQTDNVHVQFHTFDIFQLRKAISPCLLNGYKNC